MNSAAPKAAELMVRAAVPAKTISAILMAVSRLLSGDKRWWPIAEVWRAKSASVPNIRSSAEFTTFLRTSRETTRRGDAGVTWERALMNLTLRTIPTLRPKLRKVPRRSFSFMAMAFDCRSLRWVSSIRSF